MTRIVVACEIDAVCQKVAGLLEKSGITVRFKCHTGAEIIRAIKLMGGGVVVLGGRLRDMTADDLAFELHSTAYVLLLAHAEQLAECGSAEILKLALPAPPSEIRGSINILIQMDNYRSRLTVPQRSEEEQQIIAEAKALLMRRDLMTEDEAHRYLQRKSMDMSRRMVETARAVLEKEVKR